MESKELINEILDRLQADVTKLGSNFYRIIYFNLTESIKKDGCFESEAIVNTEMGIYIFSYCLCETENGVTFCESENISIGW
ncbi:MAG: hypothetical protein N2Z81_01680 [Hydrogenothermaceae bacterium]|nr:hypothetical protein [Hydrogenothermaceae bacterium]